MTPVRSEMRRSPLSRTRKALKRTALTRTRFVGKPTSKARTHRARMDELRPVAFARDSWHCRVRSSGCNGRAEHAHHVLPRGRGGPDTLDNLISVCRYCHDFLHANPAWSYERGVLVSGYGALRTWTGRPGLENYTCPLCECRKGGDGDPNKIDEGCLNPSCACHEGAA